MAAPSSAARTAPLDAACTATKDDEAAVKAFKWSMPIQNGAKWRTDFEDYGKSTTGSLMVRLKQKWKVEATFCVDIPDNTTATCRTIAKFCGSSGCPTAVVTRGVKKVGSSRLQQCKAADTIVVPGTGGGGGGGSGTCSVGTWDASAKKCKVVNTATFLVPVAVFAPIPDNDPTTLQTSVVVIPGDLDPNDPDGNGKVPPGAIIQSAVACFNISHPAHKDLELSVGKDSISRFVLKPASTGSAAALRGEYCFADGGALGDINTASGDPRTEGTYAPANPMSVFIGTPAPGTWNFKISDIVAGNTGNLYSAGATFTYWYYV